MFCFSIGGSPYHVLFFHRNIEKVKLQKRWGVFRIELDKGLSSETRLTPEEISAMTPVAIDETRVAVATIRQSFSFDEDELSEEQYRHIEIFDISKPNDEYTEITRKTRPKADHFNPFVIREINGGVRAYWLPSLQ